MTASISPRLQDPRCVSKLRVFLWFDCVRVCIHAYLVVFPSIYEALRMCVCALQAVYSHCAHSHIHMRERKENQLVCFKHISKAPGAL